MKTLIVSEYMIHQPIKFDSAMTIASAVELFLKKPQIGAPVVDSENHVIGFLSEQDCLNSMLESTYLGESHEIVADKMRTEVLTVSPNDSILDIAKSMTAKRPNVYPVVDDNNKLLGVITRHHLLEAIDNQLNANYQKGHARLV